MLNKKISIMICIFFLFNLNLQSKKTAVAARLKQIKEIINSSIIEWDYTTDHSKWKKYKTGNGINKKNIKFRTLIKATEIFCGTKVSGTPLYVNIHFHSRGFSEIKVTLNNQLMGIFSIDGPPGTGRNLQKVFLITKLSFPRVYELDIQVKNRGFKPFRKSYWPPRKRKLKEPGLKFKIKKAEIYYPDAAQIQEKVKKWLLSMQIAVALLYPDFPRFTNTGSPVDIKDNIDTQKNRRKPLEQILKKSVQAFDLNALKQGNKQKLNRSIQVSYSLAQELKKFSRKFEVYLVGNSHIDIAWLWRINETIQVAKNTFAAVLGNMVEYPELHYAQSQALIYEWIEKRYPNLFEQIKKKVLEGKWEIVGGMWVEPDCNIISGES